MRVILVVAGVIAAAFVLGNLLILAAAARARHLSRRRRAAEPEAPGPPVMPGARNFRVVDERVWRGGAPTDDGYASLARLGARRIVDLRAEVSGDVERGRLGALGLDYVHLPIRDGQPPRSEQVEQFLEVVRDAPGPVYLHCGAGVGRTGSMIAAYLEATDGVDARARVRDMLSVGPPTLEQIVYAARVEDGVGRVGLPVVVVSRLLDAPRRTFHRLGF